VSNPAWEALHRDFHRALLSRCPSRWLLSFCDTLAEEAYRFRQVSVDKSFGKRAVHDEHMAIFTAVVEGRADDAVKLLTAHYQLTAHDVANAVKERAGRAKLAAG
jgi:DNA-binding GntR family transcriptional regulator